jgi:ParB family chromosome partitioning protein
LRSLVLAAALLLAAWEDKTGPHTWRNPSDDARRYLGQMIAWGYSPSEVEQLILAPTTDD